MTTTFESRFQPLVQDVHSLLFTHELRRQDQQIRVPMLPGQLRYLLIPCQGRPHLGEAVRRVRHAQSCTTRQDSALHVATTHGLGNRLSIIGIVIRRVELLRPHIDRLVAELLQLVYQPILEVEPDMIRADIDLLRQSSVSPSRSQQSVSRPGDPPLYSSACSLQPQYRTPSISYRKSRPPCCAHAPSSTPRARHSHSLTRRR